MNYIIDGPANLKIRPKDSCVIYVSEHLRYTLRIEQDVEIQTKFGIIKAVDLIDHPYGVKFELKRGWVLPLRLTPELWTQLLPHRTQILYQADISMILLQLDIKPNSIVVECGTGSGSLSHAILRACLPNGFLYTFDINEKRAKEAQAEFERHGYEKNVLVSHRNVCELGFGDELEGKANACMLDLPTTWLAIESAHKTLRNDGAWLCAFSPCIEQVQQNVAKMNELNMKDIRTVECLLRPFEIKTHDLRMWDEDVLQGLTAIEKVKFKNLEKTLAPNKRLRVDEEKSKLEQEPVEEVKVIESSMETDDADLLDIALSDPKANFNPNMLTKNSYMFAKQPNESVSHSGFLTFACKRR